MKKYLFFIVFSFWVTNIVAQDNLKAEINNTLDAWHKAAAEANFNNYFDTMTDDAIFIGTDASERWTKTELFSFCEPYFKKGKAWDFKAFDRKIYFSEDGKTAWFNELLNT